MRFIVDDGGRADAGYKGTAGDCVARAIAIVTARPYRDVYAELAAGAGIERKSRGASARNGIWTQRAWFKRYMTSHGFQWTPTMRIGSGCTVHLVAHELPPGRLVVSLSGHYCAVIDGVIHDLYNPDRGGTRCVYGYWRLA